MPTTNMSHAGRDKHRQAYATGLARFDRVLVNLLPLRVQVMSLSCNATWLPSL